MSVVGFTKKSRLDALPASVAQELPEEFWTAAEALLPESRYWLDPPW